MLTPEQSEFYRANGFLTGLTVVGAEEAVAYREQFDALERRLGPEQTRIGLIDRHFDEPFIMELATKPAILDAVEALIGPNVLLLATHFFCKYGQDSKWVAWHQDVTYWGLEPPTAITAWFAVDDSDAENGCMRVIPGSHLGGLRAHGKSDREGNLLSINQEALVRPEEEREAIDLPLHAGQISLHDGALVHGSLPNRSSRRRCGLTLRYIPAHVREVVQNPSTGPRWKTLLVRGISP
jgi:ectoine hydroxylase-related dioxygenase (phytanoyl-CoA dioxygenase family)